MIEEQADFNVFKLSEVGKQDEEHPLNVKRYSFDNHEEYDSVLDSAMSEGVAFLIEGTEPDDDEMRQIKRIFDVHGRVKIFRKRKVGSIDKNIVIQPSEFNGIERSEAEDEKLKESVCQLITDLIDLSYST